MKIKYKTIEEYWVLSKRKNRHIMFMFRFGVFVMGKYFSGKHVNKKRIIKMIYKYAVNIVKHENYIEFEKL